MDGTLLLYVVIAFVALWFILTPFAIASNILYGLGADWARPYYTRSRGMHLLIGFVALLIYASIIASIFGLPIIEIVRDTFARFL